MELEEGLLALTETESSSDYKSEREASISSTLSLYILLLSTSPPLLPTLIDFLPFYNMSQHSTINYKQIILQ